MTSTCELELVSYLDQRAVQNRGQSSRCAHLRIVASIVLRVPPLSQQQHAVHGTRYPVNSILSSRVNLHPTLISFSVRLLYQGCGSFYRLAWALRTGGGISYIYRPVSDWHPIHP